MQRSAFVVLCLVAYAGCACAVTADVSNSGMVQQQPQPAKGTPGTSLWQGLRKLLQTANSNSNAQASFGNRKSGCTASADANAGVNFGVATADTTAQAYCWGKAARKQQKEAEKQQKQWEKEQEKLYRKQKKNDHDDGKYNKKGGNNYWGFGKGKGDNGKGGKGKGWGRKFL